MITTTYHSPLGDITLAADERGLTGLWFAGQESDGFAPAIASASAASDGATAVDVSAAFEALPAPDEVIDGYDAESGASPLTARYPENAAAVGVLERAWAWLNAYFAGHEPRWTPPLHLEGTAFQHAVWVALLSIPRGRTVTYDELAQRLAAQMAAERAAVGAAAGAEADNAVSPVLAAQAVERAVACNPIAIIVPCHRVVGADSDLTGYVGGVARKRRLLELEGVLPAGR